MAAPSNQDPIECARLWERGFPNRALPSFPCFKFGERTIDGIVHRVYSPLAWRGDTRRRDPYFSATLEAVEESIAVYKALGTVKPIYIVFSTLTTAGLMPRPTTVVLPPRGLPILIHLVATTRNDPIAFKQLIAHEIAHCFQSWNFKDQLLGPGSDSKWWSEGMAEYFSNVVYKDVNAEHQYKDEFASLSTTRPLTGMSYENFAFFQFMGNRVGPEGVIRMMRTLPTSPGVDAQLAALAAIPGIELTFEEFVRSVIDHSLKDTDGRAIIFPEEFTDTIFFTDIESQVFAGQAFVAARYMVVFPNEKRFSAETRSTGEGRSAWRVSEPAGGWGPFPASASGRCNELQVLMYATTTTPGAEREETLSTTSVTADPCDGCLDRAVGGDERQPGRLLAVGRCRGRCRPPQGGRHDGDSVSGVPGRRHRLGRVRTIQGTRDGAGRRGRHRGVCDLRWLRRGTLHGGRFTLIAAYEAGTAGAGVIVVTAELFTNGPPWAHRRSPFGRDLPVVSGIPTTYSCEGDTLTMFPPARGTGCAGHLCPRQPVARRSLTPEAVIPDPGDLRRAQPALGWPMPSAHLILLARGKEEGSVRTPSQEGRFANHSRMDRNDWREA